MKYIAHMLASDSNGICMGKFELGGEGDRLNETAEFHIKYYRRRLAKSSTANASSDTSDEINPHSP